VSAISSTWAACAARRTCISISPASTRYEIKDTTSEQVDFLLRQKAINAEVEIALRQVLAQKSAVADLDAKLKASQKTIEQIFADQSRLRENIKALRGSAEEKALLQRYTRQLDDQESQLDARRKEMQEIQAQRDLGTANLQKMIQDLQMDVNL
jgi:chromosome segregation ATPase